MSSSILLLPSQVVPRSNLKLEYFGLKFYKNIVVKDPTFKNLTIPNTPTNQTTMNGAPSLHPPYFFVSFLTSTTP